ncbi:MAG: FAD-binding protein [Nitrososphaerota archaeon]|nr:FAD-binding protein [Candidatus Bathyarchaeota archaeon]MDW8023206.1 FAD-binding protein [Nitrososphaerota archaeon]
MRKEREVETDVLVIGGGIAGSFAAVRAREKGLNVTIVDMGYAGYTGVTRQALLGFAVYNPKWGTDLNTCIEAVSRKGEYLNDREWTEIIFKDSWKIYEELVSWGADFRLESEGYFLKKYPPFTIIPVGEYGVGPACRKRAEEVGVRIMDRTMVTDLLKKENTVVGAVGFSLYTGDLYIFKAKSTVMATGPTSLVSGDGDALAYRAGAEITGKEFPYTWPGAGGLLGGMQEVAARNVFMRFVDAEGRLIDISDKYELDLTMEFLVHAGKAPIYWDLEAATSEDIARMRKRIENAYPRFEPKFDPSQGGRRQALGGEHRMGGGTHQGGGIWLTNKKCAASLQGLFAAGECASTRALGAYHPAPGFGLLTSAVAGYRAGIGAAEHAMQADKPDLSKEELSKVKETVYEPLERKSGFDPRWTAQIIYNTMVPYFIKYIKREDRLKAALTIVTFVRDHIVPKLFAKDIHELWLAHEVKNIVLNAEMILRCSLFRTESRATHYREDYPRRVDPDWLAWVKLKDDNGEMRLWKEPIPKKWWPDLSLPYEERYPRRFPGE